MYIAIAHCQLYMPIFTEHVSFSQSKIDLNHLSNAKRKTNNVKRKTYNVQRKKRDCSPNWKAISFILFIK